MKSILKNIYGIIPFKKQVFSFIKLFWLPPERIYRHLHFKGIIKIKVPPGKSFRIKHYGYQVENDIFWKGITGGWEKESIRIWMELCKNARVILDIGANTGVYALIAKTVNPSSKVYAFEPVKRVYEKLAGNVSLNNYEISCIEAALSDKNGTAVIYDTDTEHTYSVTVNRNLNTTGEKVREVEIKTLTLSSFIELNRIDRIDLIKIDVESHEPEVLEGFKKHLEKMRPAMLIEILNNSIGMKVQDLLQNKDYLYFRIESGGAVKTADIRIKDKYCNYLVCSAETAQYLKLN